jgi:predicted metallopeptidase
MDKREAVKRLAVLAREVEEIAEASHLSYIFTFEVPRTTSDAHSNAHAHIYGSPVIHAGMIMAILKEAPLIARVLISGDLETEECGLSIQDMDDESDTKQ